MAVTIVGMCRGTFLKSRERRLKSEKEKQDEIEKEKKDEFLAKVARGELEIPDRLKTGSKNIELPS